MLRFAAAFWGSSVVLSPSPDRRALRGLLWSWDRAEHLGSATNFGELSAVQPGPAESVGARPHMTHSRTSPYTPRLLSGLWSGCARTRELFGNSLLRQLVARWSAKLRATKHARSAIARTRGVEEHREIVLISSARQRYAPQWSALTRQFPKAAELWASHGRIRYPSSG